MHQRTEREISLLILDFGFWILDLKFQGAGGASKNE
jgi:hypothetical protein